MYVCISWLMCNYMYMFLTDELHTILQQSNLLNDDEHCIQDATRMSVR